MKRAIVTGQKVSRAKRQLAREFRRQMTEEERVLWQHLRKSQLDGFHFRRQQIIDGFIVDFYCHAAGLVVEVDGLIHNARSEYDAERDGILAQRGLRVLRIKNEDIRRDVNAVLNQIRNHLNKIS